MRPSEISADRVILVLGAPRSGTSWLAKIFDSHPEVLYRHEPDTVLRDYDLPWMCPPEQVPAYRDAARDYLRRLFDTATLKTAGSLPIFPKRHHGAVAAQLRAGMIYGLRAIEQVPGARRLVRGVPIPDLFDVAAYPALRLVLKSVSSRGRARLFAEAMPGMKTIFILRDPWGQVASMLRGAALGKFEVEVPVQELLTTEQARRYGLTPERFAALPSVEQFAWNWAILNEKAIDDLAGIDGVKVLRYHALCDSPLVEARALFAFAGLDWNRQTEDFVRRSTTFNGRDRYYQVFKNTQAAMNRWREELKPEDQRRIQAVVRETSLAPLCPELEI
ncbi:MAG TPA: sulfotransferase [Acetobacteraceae bacterium]|nr:sulfotransferase [Acetobacteraceae bacterium]